MVVGIGVVQCNGEGEDGLIGGVLETIRATPTLISLLGDAPCGLGWQVEHKACTCLCDHRHHGCSVDFHLPGSQLRVHYSNLRWGRTLDDRRRADVAELNRAAFAG